MLSTVVFLVVFLRNRHSCFYSWTFRVPLDPSLGTVSSTTFYAGTSTTHLDMRPLIKRLDPAERMPVYPGGDKTAFSGGSETRSVARHTMGTRSYPRCCKCPSRAPRASRGRSSGYPGRRRDASSRRGSLQRVSARRRNVPRLLTLLGVGYVLGGEPRKVVGCARRQRRVRCPMNRQPCLPCPCIGPMPPC